MIKVADFGCSSATLGGGETSDAGHGTVAGTTVYMAPEVMGADEQPKSATLIMPKFPLFYIIKILRYILKFNILSINKKSDIKKNTIN